MFEVAVLECPVYPADPVGRRLGLKLVYRSGVLVVIEYSHVFEKRQPSIWLVRDNSELALHIRNEIHNIVACLIETRLQGSQEFSRPWFPILVGKENRLSAHCQRIPDF